MPSVDLPPSDAIMSLSRPVDECSKKRLLQRSMFSIVSLPSDGLDHGLTASHESDHSLRRKRTSTSSLTPKKKLRPDSSPIIKPIVDENANDIQPREEIDLEKNSIDYLSLQPERIVSITRSRLPSQQLEFLLKCSQCPTKLFFISNERAKELVPDLLIEFYEKHINWFIDRPPPTTLRQRTQARRESHSTHRANTSR